jgi:hypothetical protein
VNFELTLGHCLNTFFVALFYVAFYIPHVARCLGGDDTLQSREQFKKALRVDMPHYKRFVFLPRGAWSIIPLSDGRAIDRRDAYHPMSDAGLWSVNGYDIKDVKVSI